MLKLIEQLSQGQVDDLMELYAPEFWTSHRTKDDVARMLASTGVVLGVVDTEQDDRLVGFSRVLTDFVYRATLYDVIVAPSHRGRGVARLLMDAVVNHPRLRTVEYIDLSCKPDKVSLYEKWGFTADLSGTLFLRRCRES